jgi:hypothetical protein
MLTAEKIKASAALAALTEEQIKAISELSQNDENAVIAKKTGDIYGGIDKDIEEVTGLKKPEGVKTYEWMKRDILPKVKEGTDLQQQITAEKQKVSELTEQIKKGATDPVIKKELEDSKALVTQLQTKLTESKTTFETELSKAAAETLNIRVSNEFDKALLGKKFKDESIISKPVRESFLANAKATILAENKADFIDDGQGGKRLVFRDATGEIKRNAENNLNPYTAEELFTSKIVDVLDLGKKQPGAGSKEPGAGGTGGGALDLSGAKTQLQADELTTDYLMGKGVVRGTSEYNDEFSKIRTENKVMELPLR